MGGRIDEYREAIVEHLTSPEREPRWTRDEAELLLLKMSHYVVSSQALLVAIVSISEQDAYIQAARRLDTVTGANQPTLEGM